MRLLLLVGLIGSAITLAVACGGGGSDELDPIELRATRSAQIEKVGAQEEETGFKSVEVLEIISGTKIAIDIEKGIFDVRYIGITVSDPDFVLDDGRTVKQAAFDLNRSMAPVGSMVELEKGAVDRDPLGNLTRYVYSEGEMINKALVAAGLATVKESPSDTKHQAELLAAQEEAKANQRGMWKR